MKENLQPKTIFRFFLALSLFMLAVIVTLIVFCFVYIAELGLLSCLFVGIGMATLIVLTVLTVMSGLRAYRN